MVSGAVFTLVLQQIGHQLYPPPADMNPQDPASIAAHIKAMPAGALVSVLCSYFFGCLGGSMVAGKIAQGDSGPVYTTGALLLMSAVLNLIMIAHPAWFTVAVPIVFIASTLLALKLIER